MTPEEQKQPEKPGLDFSRVRQSMQFRFNPVRQATAERLGTELDAFYQGSLTIARFWEAMQNRDPEVRTAGGKRGDAVETLNWTVNVDEDAFDDDDAAAATMADEQKKALQRFYSRLCVTDILKQDTRGGVGVLARQMLDARAKGWAVHEIVWKPDPNGELCAELRFCPLYWFENRFGKLRFLESDYQTYGVEMKEHEWLVTTADNYMEAVTTLWLCKRSLLQAWVRFCEKFGQPLPVIKTDSAKGSAEWNNAEDALAAIGEDWGLVLNNGASLEFPSLDRSGDNTFHALHEDLKRTIVTIILGSDLATISAGSGSGQGASLQGQEDAKRERADASLISETLNRQLDKFVINYMFGPDVPVLVKFALVPSKRQDIAQELAVDKEFNAMGIEISKSDIRERYGRSEPKDGEELVGQVDQPDSVEAGKPNAAEPDNTAPMSNEAQFANALRNEAIKEIAKARALEVVSIADTIKDVLSIDDPDKLLNALKVWQLNSSDRAKRLLANPSHFGLVFEKHLAAGVLNGLTSASKA